MQEIAARLAALPDTLSPLREAASRYLRYPSLVEDGTLCIGHRPWVAELNYMFRLYLGLAREELDRYGSRFGLEVPLELAAFLGSVNGAFCFGMSLCGVPRPMRGGNPLLDRSVLYCHDLATAAHQWAGEYHVPDGLFHFGGRHYSYRENVGYFIDRDGRLLSFKKRGKVVGEWADFSAFLEDELRASEDLEAELHPPKWNA